MANLIRLKGASGGLKPQIVVTAPNASTIDIMQGSVILQTYTLTGSETSHTFEVALGTYSVRGTLSTETETKTVVVDEVAQYQVVIEYYTYLYNEGDERTAITGGINTTVFYDSHSSAQCTKQTGHIKMYTTANSAGYYGNARIAVANRINLTPYTKFGFTFDLVSYSKVWGSHMCLEYVTSWNSTIYEQSYPTTNPTWSERNIAMNEGGTGYVPNGHTVLQEYTYKMDITNINTTYYIGLKQWGGNFETHIKKIWLE